MGKVSNMRSFTWGRICWLVSVFRFWGILWVQFPQPVDWFASVTPEHISNYAGITQMNTDDERRLDLLKTARTRSGLPLDFWADLTEGLDYSSLEILVGRSSIFPKYMNSSGKL
jgi:hypothetical protein